MTVAVQQPVSRQKKDPLEVLAQGLGIAQSITGIKSNMAALEQHQKAQTEHAEEVAAMKKNMISGEKEATLRAGGAVDAKPGEAGAVQFTKRNNDGSESALWLAIKPKNELKPPTHIGGFQVKGTNQPAFVSPGQGYTDASGRPVEVEPIPAKPSPDDRKNPNQTEINAIVAKNASKKSIANQLEADFKEFQNAKTETDKIRIGQQMIKTLNSKEGADAVGTEEANRLAGALEYQKFNVFGAGPMFGRDLPGFEEQVVSTINGIRGGIDLNNSSITDLSKGYKGPTVQAQTRLEAPKKEGKGGSGTALAGPKKGGALPGTVIEVGGKRYTVGADGDTLTPVGGK